MREGRSYQRKKTPLRPKIAWGRGLEREKSVWGGEGTKTVERDRRKMRENVLKLYIGKHDSRWIERCREVSSTNSR